MFTYGALVLIIAPAVWILLGVLFRALGHWRSLAAIWFQAPISPPRANTTTSTRNGPKIIFHCSVRPDSHSSIRMTADVYGHVLEPQRRAAADAMAAALGG